ncbi:MAG: dTDP-4-dehydrorhamnose reductase [Candidatus Binatia bacterium]|nr:dTDP-4-dehydrorhamnose reductase [Candidatus Binatia bacterium]
MKILLTGAAGQLGRSLRRTLHGHDVVACEHGRLDIADLAAVREAVAAEKPDLILNAAAHNRVDDAESDPGPAYRGNAVGPRNLALASNEVGAAVVHVSTDYVFDGRGNRPYHEYDVPAPRSAYGASKLAGEVAVREANPRHYIARTAWVYHEERGNFPRTMLSLRDRDEVRVVNDQVGSPTYAPHLADALTTLIETEAFGTYHLAGAGQASWFDLTCELYRREGITTSVVPVTTEEFPRPAERPQFSVLETVQEPRIVLPAWQDGLAAFCTRLHRAA